jgi:hypothetical protein
MNKLFRPWSALWLALTLVFLGVSSHVTYGQIHQDRDLVIEVFDGEKRNESQLYEVADLFHERAGQFACESVWTEIDRIQQQKSEDILHQMQVEIEALEQKIASEENLQVRQNLLSLKKELQVTASSPDPKKTLLETMNKICKAIRVPIIASGYSLAAANAALFNAAITPFAGLYNLIAGMTGDRERSELGERTDFLYHVMGPSKGIPMYLLTSLGSQAAIMLLQFNPVILAVNASLMIEMITHYSCRKPNPDDEAKVKFCQSYHSMKDFFHRPAQAAYRLGSRIQSLIDQRLIRRRADFPPEKFCSFSRVRQVKRGKRLLKRYRNFRDDERFKNIQLLLPIHRNNCTKILFMFDRKIPDEYSDMLPEVYYQQKIDELRAERSHVEGIEIVYIPEHQFPKEYYFTEEEIEAMPTSEQLCHEVEQSHLSSKAQIKGKLISNFLKSSLAPSLLGMPDSQKVVSEDEDVKRGEVSSLRNIIFSIGPRSDNLDQLQKVVEERDRLRGDVDWLTKKLKKRKSFSRCMKYIQDNGVDVAELERKLLRIKEISAMPEVRKHEELIAVRKFVWKGDRNLKFHWELVETNNILKVYKTLKSRDVGNVIIISHGKEDGFLVDSFGHEYPKAFFAEISPSIMSINFYSCYSQDLVELYDLKAKLSSAPSFYKIRYVTSVSENNFFDSSSFAPVSAFADYLRSLDKYLNHGFKGALAVQNEFGQELSQYQSQQMCQMDISDIEVEKGTYAIELNKNFVGLVSEQQNDGQLTYPCSFLKEEKNSLKVKNIVNAGGSRIANLKEFVIKVGDKVLTPAYSRLRLNSYISFRF